ncbi:MAG: UvrD-helicase domain-containing protein [Deltaproteobacteria bacterium]|nr:UvrD-helicase domain-containing protein [Deltaproteobacteria bacterium]
MTAAPWPTAGPLPDDPLVFLEASAGTGKTYAIEGIVAQLVAEHGLGIQQILVITFTKAATADLRRRVRERLIKLHGVVATGSNPDDDLLGARWANHPDPTLLAARLAQALADFDRAGISTIHGFCQRMLQELAFESGQEPALEVVGDASEVREQVVADHLAQVYARARIEDLQLLDDMGWRPAALRKLALQMTAPTRPDLRPEPEPTLGDPLAVVAVWRQLLGDFAEWYLGPQGRRAAAAWTNEANRPTQSKAKGALYRRLSRLNVEFIDAFARWLDGPGLRAKRPMVTSKNWLDPEMLAREWDTVEGPIQEFEGYGLCVRFMGLCEAQDALWRQPLVRFARDARGAFEAEIERRAQLTYDGMLSRLAERLDVDALAGRTALADAIRSRFRAALVDEFQDTDGAQWRVLRQVFDRSEARLFVVGDPKQAIYRFRGADLAVYVQARSGRVPWALDTNRRTDRPLVEALHALWGRDPDLSLSAPRDGDPVCYVRVQAHEGVRVRDLPAVAGPDGSRARQPLEIRWFHPGTVGLAMDERATVDDARDACARLCAAEVVALLSSDAHVQPKAEKPWRPIAPGDVAVLCRTHQQAAAVRDLLRALGVPAVASDRVSIFRSEVAPWLMAWCDAVAAPADERPARGLAVTPLVGWTADQLTRALSVGGDPTHVADRAAWEGLRRHVAACAKVYASGGFARALDQTLATFDVVRRLVASAHGERAATDLRHLAELCHVRERERRCGPQALGDWLRNQVADPDDRNDEQTIRLESDAAAVQLVTLHASKGLEYPFVLLPFSWAGTGVRDCGQGLLLRDPPGSERAMLDLSIARSLPRTQAVEAEEAALFADALRLVYVAMTRARHHLVVWFGCPDGDASTPLATLLLGHADGAIREQLGLAPRPGKAPTVAEKLATLASQVPRLLQACSGRPDSGIGWSEASDLPPPQRWMQRETPLPVVAARPFDPHLRLGTGWLVTSFSALARGREYQDDEPVRWVEELAGDPLDGETSALAPSAEPPVGPLPVVEGWWLDPAPGVDLPGGTRTGDWLHAVFEHLAFDSAPGQDPVARDGRSATELVTHLAAHSGIDDPHAVATAVRLLPAWLDTPLDGGPAGYGLPAGWSLRQLRDADRIDELGFDLRLGAGATFLASAKVAGGPHGLQVHSEGVRRALQAAARDPQFGGSGWVRAWLDQTDNDGAPKHLLPEVAGMLTGFVDLVFRVGGRGADAVYYVADYKTNAVLGPSALREAMAGALAARHPAGAPRLINCAYARPMLQWAMGHAAYHLQALLYTVALHRLLRTRLGDAYDYDRHVGGHLYLFLKGMGGPATPTCQGARLGVWADRWPKATVAALDRAFDGEEASP